MRLYGLVLAGLLVTGAPCASWGQTTAVVAGTQAIGLSAAAGQSNAADVRTEILRAIAERKPRSDADMVEVLDALGTLYATEIAAPLFTGPDGLTSRGRAIVEELARAEEWGLQPEAYEVSLPVTPSGDPALVARNELELALAALRYASDASQGRFKPSQFSLWYERASGNFDPAAAMRAIATSGDPAAALVAQHPSHRQFHLLRAAYLAQKFPGRFQVNASHQSEPEPPRFEPGRTLNRGDRDPQVVLLRQRLNVPSAHPDDVELYDAEVATAVNKFMRSKGWRRKVAFDNKVRSLLNDQNAGTGLKATRVSVDDLLINMEKWRWLPRDLGAMHVQNNLPAFETRLVRDGNLIHSERIIIGKPNTQTPVFSDRMTHVVFKPQWGVPNSIKIQSLLPRLASGDHSVLDRRGMAIVHEGRKISPSRYDWRKTDISSVPIVQGAGPSNPLGQVKFMFPNHHAVYMHDTPDKHLFNSRERTFSHGCIRVRNPVRLAEVVFRETAGWQPDEVISNLDRRAEENNRIDLPVAIPVHNTYFTVVAGEDGAFTTYKDIYSHDKRIAQALAGKSLDLIARSDPARAQKRELEQLARSAKSLGFDASRRTASAEFGFDPASQRKFRQYQQGLGVSPFYGSPPSYALPKPAKVSKKSNPYANNPARKWSVQVFGGW
ncbi:MAG: L,D-transpeptidase family protein [Hyphomicrobiaceae bacterium]|nr:L,D-transpeptidase family protein [Hyphomicrobiaceae bacterium]